MKKIALFISMALLGLAVHANDCPTESKLYLLNGEDAANVEIELGFSKNISTTLCGFAFQVNKPENAVWKKNYGNDIFTPQGYAPYILGELSKDALEIIGDQLEEHLNNLCDVLNYVQNDKLVIIEAFKTTQCRFFPATPGKVGKFSIDMSALDDGKYEIFVDNTSEGSNLIYKSAYEGQNVWIIDEPMVLTLTKEGNSVTETGSIAATFAPAFTAITTVDGTKQPQGVRYYNLAGVESAEPQPGVNLKVTTYSDGSRTTHKIIK